MRRPTRGGSADHTTSRRHRAGSRRNKRLRNAGTFITDLTPRQRWGRAVAGDIPWAHRYGRPRITSAQPHRFIKGRHQYAPTMFPGHVFHQHISVSR